MRSLPKLRGRAAAIESNQRQVDHGKLDRFPMQFIGRAMKLKHVLRDSVDAGGFDDGEDLEFGIRSPKPGDCRSPGRRVAILIQSVCRLTTPSGSVKQSPRCAEH